MSSGESIHLAELQVRLLAFTGLSYELCGDLIGYLVTNKTFNNNGCTLATGDDKQTALAQIFLFNKSYLRGWTKTDETNKAIYSDIKNKVVRSTIDFNALDLAAFLEMLRNITFLNNLTANVKHALTIIKCLRTLVCHTNSDDLWNELNTKNYPNGVSYFTELSHKPTNKEELVNMCCDAITEISNYLKDNKHFNSNDCEKIEFRIDDIIYSSKSQLLAREDIKSSIKSQLTAMQLLSYLNDIMGNRKVNLTNNIFNFEMLLTEEKSKQASGSTRMTFKKEDVRFGTELYNRIHECLISNLESELQVKQSSETYKVMVNGMSHRGRCPESENIVQIAKFKAQVHSEDPSLIFEEYRDPMCQKSINLRNDLEKSLKEILSKNYCNPNISVDILTWEIKCLLIQFNISRGEDWFMNVAEQETICSIIKNLIEKKFEKSVDTSVHIVPQYTSTLDALDVSCSIIVFNEEFIDTISRSVKRNDQLTLTNEGAVTSNLDAKNKTSDDNEDDDDDDDMDKDLLAKNISKKTFQQQIIAINPAKDNTCISLDESKRLRLPLLLAKLQNILRERFHKHCPVDPDELSILQHLQKTGKLRKEQYELILPQCGRTDSTKFDITILSTLLLEICDNLEESDREKITQAKHARNNVQHLSSADATKQFSYKFIKPVANFIGREDEIEQIHQHLDSINNSSDKYGVVIYGMAGVGKTETVRKYWMRFSDSYYDGRIIWINAQSQNSIETDFVEIAKQAGLSVVGADGNSLKPINEIVQMTNWHFARREHGQAQRKILFVFDNVVSIEDLKSFLPASLNSSPFMILTSQHQDWDPEHFDILPIDILSEKLAHEFLSKNLQVIQRKDESFNTELISLLQCHPLALQQAVSYIRVNNISVENYVTLLKRSDWRKLADQMPKSHLREHSVFKTFSLCIQNLAADKTHPFALNLLKTLA